MASTALIGDSYWLPLICWAQVNTSIQTRLNVFPSLFTRDPKAEFETRIRLFQGEGKPLVEYISPVTTIHHPLRIEFSEILKSQNIEQLDGIAEIWTRQIGVDPPRPRFLEVWCDYTSTNQSLDVSIPAVPIVGSMKVPMSGTHRFQLFPGIIESEQFSTEALIINPYSRAIDVFFSISNESGQKKQSNTHRIGPRNYLKMSMHDLFPDLPNFFGAKGLGTLVVGSTFKLAEFVIIRPNKPGGVTTCIDHMVPFIEELREEMAVRQKTADPFTNL